MNVAVWQLLVLAVLLIVGLVVYDRLGYRP